jgi:hypothetical protein
MSRRYAYSLPRVLACFAVVSAGYALDADETAVQSPVQTSLAPVVFGPSHRLAQAPPVSPTPLLPAPRLPNSLNFQSPSILPPITQSPGQGFDGQPPSGLSPSGQQPAPVIPPGADVPTPDQPLPNPQVDAPQLDSLLAQRPTPRNTGRSVSFGSDLFYLFDSANLIGDFFDGSLRQIRMTNTVLHQFHAMGTPFTPPGTDGGPGALILFERNGTGPPNDISNIPGTGTDVSGDGWVDRFQIAEPIPPNEVPTSPGPTFNYDGGTAVYTPSASAVSPSTQPEDGRFTTGQAETWFVSYSYSEQQTVDFAISGGGAAVRRVKIAENNSPVPRNRVYLDYRYFDDVVAGIGNVHRFSPGVETTLWSELASIDIRFPIAATMSTTQTLGRSVADDVELGNIAVIFKRVLKYTDRSLISAGIGTMLPTGDDARLNRADGTPILEFENSAVHVAPFIAGLWQPNEKSYFQGFLQVDVDTSGNEVRGDSLSSDLPTLGVMQDSTLLFADLSMGHWIVDRSACGGLVRRVAGIAELHYSASVQDADIVQGRGLLITDFSNRINVLTATTGFHYELAHATHITTAMSFPLRNGEDRFFDFEVGVLLNAYF